MQQPFPLCLAQHHPAQALPRTLTALDQWLFSNTTAALERAWSDATRQRALSSSFLVAGGDIHAAALTGAVDPVSLQPNSAGFVPGICELCRARAVPRVSTAHSTEGIESRVKSIAGSPPPALGVIPQLCQSMGVIHGDFTGQKLQQKFVQGVGFALVTPGTQMSEIEPKAWLGWGLSMLLQV